MLRPSICKPPPIDVMLKGEMPSMTEEDGTKSLEHVSKGGYSIGPSWIQVPGHPG